MTQKLFAALRELGYLVLLGKATSDSVTYSVPESATILFSQVFIWQLRVTAKPAGAN